VLSFFNTGVRRGEVRRLRNYVSLLITPRSGRRSATRFFTLVHLIPVMGARFCSRCSCSPARWADGKGFQARAVFAAGQTGDGGGADFRHFRQQHGAVNQLFGLSVSWLEDPAFLRWSVVIMSVWRPSLVLIVFLAGLTTIQPLAVRGRRPGRRDVLQRTVRITIR
jgi:hypothetical protein